MDRGDPTGRDSGNTPRGSVENRTGRTIGSRARRTPVAGERADARARERAERVEGISFHSRVASRDARAGERRGEVDRFRPVDFDGSALSVA